METRVKGGGLDSLWRQGEEGEEGRSGERRRGGADVGSTARRMNTRHVVRAAHTDTDRRDGAEAGVTLRDMGDLAHMVFLRLHVCHRYNTQQRWWNRLAAPHTVTLLESAAWSTVDSFLARRADALGVCIILHQATHLSRDNTLAPIATGKIRRTTAQRANSSSHLFALLLT